MKPKFKIEKLPLDVLINLFIQLYESGVDFVDLSADNTDPNQDKLIIVTQDGYIDPKFSKENPRGEFEKLDYDEDDEDEDDEEDRIVPPNIEIKRLSDDDIEKLL